MPTLSPYQHYGKHTNAFAMHILLSVREHVYILCKNSANLLSNQRLNEGTTTSNNAIFAEK